MSKIWSFIIILSIIFSIATNNVDIVISSITENSKNAVTNILNLTGMMCFWSGIFKIFEKTSLMKSLSNIIGKFIYLFFDKKEVNEKCKNYMSLNIASNLIGIGNASTINGIKAMKELDSINNNIKPNNSMTKFVLLNTASIQLIPTSMIALRTLYKSQNPTQIIIPVIIITFISLIVGFTSIIVLNKLIK